MRVARLMMLLVLLCPVAAFSQPKDDLLNDLSVKWSNAKTYALKMAEAMPEENYGFRPVPDEMTFAGQLVHIAQNMSWLSSAFLLGSAQNKKQDANSLTKQQIIQLLSAAYDSSMAVHYRLSPQQLNEEVKFFAGPMNRRQILILMHDHQTHHLGQLIVYLRLKGIKPPDYVGW